ncbi:MAG: 16S rRNA (cytosine(1402)-N(4))-methyltransferase RsmH [Betaproteobacteria bacterium]|nr:16S rRNA (cytosine(1402)-N(4))-methyltransferase RsmH [Betaproteobacteria bacterium]
MAASDQGCVAMHHITVLLAEAVEALAVQPSGIYVDGTFGRGGHSRRILESLGPEGRLIALDRDLAAVKAGALLDDPRFEIVHARFSSLQSVLQERGITRVDGVLLDLGVSSPQIDEAVRGFSFRFDGPLDMRMDTASGEPASAWLAQADRDEIARVIREYGEERFARQIAQAIVTARLQQPIETTGQLARIVAKAVRTREPGQDPATRTFQALRLHVNRELEEIEAVLPQALQVLNPGGRLVVISFHSLEDRLVKRFMRAESLPPEIPRGVAVRENERPIPRLRLVGKAVRPSVQEVSANPRSRSAVMRVAERTAA